MKRINNIFEKICDEANIRLAYKESSRGKHHYIEVKEFEKDIDGNLQELRDSLLNQTYSIPSDDYTFKIINDKGKERELMKLKYYPHRIVQWAIMLQIEREFLKTIPLFACASIPNRGIDRAYDLVVNALKDRENTTYCLKLDIKKFYPNIDKENLKQLLRHKFKDKKLLWLLDLIIDSYPREKGVPIGSYTSQYFANFYLAYFDHWLKREKKIKYVIRYMDDIVILHKDKQFLHNLRLEIADYLDKKLKLTIKENYQVFPVESRGIDFVGFVFRHRNIRLRRKNALALRKVSNSIMRRNRKQIMINYNQFCSINSRLGFFKYFDHNGLYKTYIKPLLNIMKKYYESKIVTGKTQSEKGSKVIRYFRNINMKFYERKKVKLPSHKSKIQD